LQSMDAGISNWLSKLQERIFKSFSKRSRNRAWTHGSQVNWLNFKKEVSKVQEAIKRQSLYDWWWQSHKKIKSYYGKGHFLPEKEFFRRRTSSVKTWPWKHLRRCFLILKSLNNDNLRRRLQESIITLGSFKEPWKFFRMQAWRRRQSKNPKGSSEHLPIKEKIVKMNDC